MFQPDDEEKQPEVDLKRVSQPGAIHNLDKLGQNYKAMAGHVAFAVADREQMAKDVTKINGYIEALKGNGDRSEFANASHDAVNHLPRIRYKVDDRVYDTHDDSSQLFPISGAGVSSGKGPVDMVTVLKTHNKLTIERYLTLAQIYHQKNNLPLTVDEQKGVNSMKKTAKVSLRQKFVNITGAQGIPDV